MSDPNRRRPAILSLILRTPFYRGAMLSLFFSGLGISATNPLLSLFLVGELGASLPVAGLFYLTNLAAPVVGFWIGSLSDRRRDRLPLFRLGSVLGAVGWVAMAFSTHVWMPFVLSLTLLSVAGATGSLIYAAARDELTLHPSGADNRVISTIRLAFSVGFVLGPVLGSVFGGLFGLRAMLVATGVCSLLQILPLARTRMRRDIPPRAKRATGGNRRRQWKALTPLLVFLGLCVLAMCGDTVKFAYLPIYMEQQLHTPAALRGAVISSQSLLMLVFIPVLGVVADRFGTQRLVIIGTVLGAGANVGYVLSDHVVGLFVATALNAGLWSAMAGLGVTVAQSFYPRGVGVASSLYFSAIRFSSAVGGVAGSIGVSALGVPGVFVVPAVLSGVATLGLTAQAIMARHRRT